MRKVRLAICDGNEMTRALLNSLFENSSRIEIVGEAADRQSAMALIREFSPDAVIIGYDLSSKEEFELRSLLRTESSQTQIIKLTELDKTVTDKLRTETCLEFHQSAMIH